MPTLTFLKHFVMAPRRVGAVSPSSPELARVVVETAELGDASVVVEFGPGTGAITGKIIEELSPDALFFGMEIDAEFAEILHKRYPNVTIFNDSAVNTRKYLAQLGVDVCDVVVSGLPWSSLEEALQDSLLDTILDVLRSGGRFVTYAYLTSRLVPGAVRFKEKLHARFHNVSTTPTVWRNLPPAFVYRAEKPF